MSTILSPRESSSIRSPTSSRTSLELPTTTQQSSRQPATRRNRSALRDYYNLKTGPPNPDQAPSSPSPLHQHADSQTAASPLDTPGFDAAAYVANTLATQGLRGVLRIESDLIAEIKSLDGERKALVYDNYSKLISATDTIRRMRGNMDPMGPATSTLSPAVSHIADTAARAAAGARGDGERETVVWVLSAPERMECLVGEGRAEEARREWGEVRGLLERWRGVEGVEELRERCEKILGDCGGE